MVISKTKRIRELKQNLKIFKETLALNQHNTSVIIGQIKVTETELAELGNPVNSPTKGILSQKEEMKLLANLTMGKRKSSASPEL